MGEVPKNCGNFLWAYKNLRGGRAESGGGEGFFGSGRRWHLRLLTAFPIGFGGPHAACCSPRSRDPGTTPEAALTLKHAFPAEHCQRGAIAVPKYRGLGGS